MDELIEALKSGGHTAAITSAGGVFDAMLTTAGITVPLVPELAVHPVYLALIIGAGGNVFPWFNDRGFWIVKEIGGLTQTETLQIWTALTTIISVTGFLVIMVLSTILPMA